MTARCLLLSISFLALAGCDQADPPEAQIIPVAAQAVAAPAQAPSAGAQPSAGGLQLAFPVACEVGRTCEVQHHVDRDPGPGVRDYRCGTQTYEKHSGVDIRLPDLAAQRRGVDVLAAAAGRVARLRDGVADVSVRATGVAAVANTECGNGLVIDHGDGWETQYCHMAQGSVRVRQGDVVQAGAPIGRIGLSGMTEYPHLHMTVRRNGQVVDPFAPEMGDPAACTPQRTLWTAQALAQMPYHLGKVLNAGFAGGPVEMEQVDTGQFRAFGPDAPYAVAYVRAITLQPGDVVELRLTAPDGAVLAQSQLPPLDRWKAQHIAYVGKKRPATGWPAGVYRAEYRVIRNGRPAVERRFEARL